jgi:hypothetical protein
MGGLRTAFLVYGLMQLLAAGWCFRYAWLYRDKDRTWQMHAKRSIARGLRPERTTEWERQQARLQVFLLAVGVGLVVMALFMIVFALVIIT